MFTIIRGISDLCSEQSYEEKISSLFEARRSINWCKMYQSYKESFIQILDEKGNLLHYREYPCTGEMNPPTNVAGLNRQWTPTRSHTVC